MLRAKSYKKKLKKSQIKLRKHKTYSIKGGNRNNNSRSKKKQKGGMIEIDGKNWNTQGEYDRYQELKEVFEERRRRNESIEITPELVMQTPSNLNNQPSMNEQRIGNMVSLLEAHLATFDPNKVSVRDYIEGNIFGDKKPFNFQNLQEIITAALAAAASSTSSSSAATAAAAAAAAAAVPPAAAVVPTVVATVPETVPETVPPARAAEEAAAAAAAAAAEKEAKLDNMAGEAAESAAGGDLQALVDMLTMILKDDESKGGGKKKIYKQKGGFEYQSETKDVENIINKYKEQQKENILSYANDMENANKDGSGDALVNFLRGAWIDYINSNLTIEKVGGQPNIQNVKEKYQTNAEEMMMDELNELIIKDDIEIIKTLDKYSKIKKFPEVFRTNQDLINKFFNEDWLEHTDNYEKKTRDLIPKFKSAVLNKDISKLESAVNEGADTGDASPGSAEPVVDAAEQTPRDPANITPLAGDPIAGGGSALQTGTMDGDGIKHITQTLQRENEILLSDIQSQISTTLNFQKEDPERFDFIKGKFEAFKLQLDNQIKALNEIYIDISKKQWTGEYIDDSEFDSSIQKINFDTVNQQILRLGDKIFSVWENIRNKYDKEFSEIRGQIITRLKAINRTAQMQKNQQGDRLAKSLQLQLGIDKSQTTSKETQNDLIIKKGIKDAIYGTENGKTGFYGDLSNYNNMMKKLNYDETNIELLAMLTKKIEIEGYDYQGILNSIDHNDPLSMVDEAENIKNVFTNKMKLILGYLSYLNICISLDINITDVGEVSKYINKITIPNFEAENIAKLSKMVTNPNNQDIFSNFYALIFTDEQSIDETRLSMYNSKIDNINDILEYLNTHTENLNSFITKFGESGISVPNQTLINILLKFDILADSIYSTVIDKKFTKWDNILQNNIDMQAARAVERKEAESKQKIHSEAQQGDEEETDIKTVSDNVKKYWNGDKGFQNIYEQIENPSSRTLNDDSWNTPNDSGLLKFFGSKYMGIYLFKAIKYFRNKPDITLNIIEKYNFYLLLYRVFTDRERDSQIFKSKNIINNDKFGFFAGDGIKKTCEGAIAELKAENIGITNFDFTTFQIKAMIYYLLYKRSSVIDMKRDKIDMFLFSIFSLLDGNCIKPRSGDYQVYISLIEFYNNRIFKRIIAKRDSIEEILEKSHLIIDNIIGRENNVEFNHQEICQKLVELIKNNLILLNPLKALYKYVFSKINVIMRISDVQCAKGLKYKPRLINKMLVSQSGDSLIFSNIENNRIKLAEEKNSTITANKRSSLKTFQFDFMNHIYGPNDTNDMMTERINYGFFNLLKSYDNPKLMGEPWRNSTFSSVYFTYGFSGSGKTYNTKEIISKLLMYIARNHDIIDRIDIRYSEIVANTTPKEDIIMSGKQFNGPISNHKAWKKIEDDYKNIQEYQNDLLPYFYTQDADKYPPLILESDINIFLKSNTLFKDFKNIFDSFNQGQDSEKFQKYKDNKNFYRTLLIYNNDDNALEELIVCFNDQIHAKYWCEKFYGFAKIFDEEQNFEYKKVTEQEIIISNRGGFESKVGQDVNEAPYQEIGRSLEDKFKEIPDGKTTGKYFNKINLGPDFNLNTKLHYNFLPDDENGWILVNGHIPIKRKLYNDIIGILSSTNAITWDSNLQLATLGDQRTINQERERLFNEIYEYATKSNNPDYNQFTFPQNSPNYMKYHRFWIRNAQNIDRFIENFPQNISYSNSNGRVKPIKFITEQNNKSISFEFDIPMININNTEIKLNLKKEMEGDLNISMKVENESSQPGVQANITAKNAIIANIDSGKAQALQNYTTARNALEAILPDDFKKEKKEGEGTLSDDAIMEGVRLLENFKFTTDNIVCQSKDETTNPDSNGAWIVFKDTQEGRDTKDGIIIPDNGTSHGLFIYKSAFYKGQPLNINDMNLSNAEKPIEKLFFNKPENLKKRYKLFFPYIFTTYKTINPDWAPEKIIFTGVHYANLRDKNAWPRPLRSKVDSNPHDKDKNDLRANLQAGKIIDFREATRNRENPNWDRNSHVGQPGKIKDKGKGREYIHEFVKYLFTGNSATRTARYSKVDKLGREPTGRDEAKQPNFTVSLLNDKSPNLFLPSHLYFFKQEFTKFFDGLNISINIIEKVAGYKDIVDNFKAARVLKDNYYKTTITTSLNMRNQILDDRDYGSPGNLKSLEQLKDIIKPIQNYEWCIESYFTNTDFLKSGNAQWNNLKLAIRKEIFTKVNNILIDKISGDIDKPANNDKFSDRFLNNIEKDYQKLLKMIKNEYKDAFNKKYKYMNKFINFKLKDIAEKDTLMTIKTDELKQQEDTKKTLLRALFGVDDANSIEIYKIPVTIRGEEQEQDIHLLKDENKMDIKTILNKNLLFKSTVNRYFNFDKDKLQKLQKILKANTILKIKTVGDQNIWEQVDESHIQSYFEQSKQLGRANSLEAFKQQETEPQYINVYQKPQDNTQEQAALNKLKNKFQYHYDAVDTFKKTSATYNNDRSSRSHLVYEIRVAVIKGTEPIKYHNIVICDLAGKEDVISDVKMKKYILNNYNGAKAERAEFPIIDNNPNIKILREWEAKRDTSKIRRAGDASAPSWDKVVDSLIILFKEEKENLKDGDRNNPDSAYSNLKGALFGNPPNYQEGADEQEWVAAARSIAKPNDSSYIRDYLIAYDKKEKQIGICESIKGAEVKESTHPVTSQMNYLIEINNKYAKDNPSSPIFYVKDGELKFYSNFDINHPYILDLRGEGRMINSTLENLEKQLKGNNDYLAPINPTFSYFKQLTEKQRTDKNFNTMQNVAALPSSDSKLSEEYKLYGKILQREQKVQNLPFLNDDEMWSSKEDDNYDKYYNEWQPCNKKLENKINTITKDNIPNYYILLAINLNDRSTETDIELKKEIDNTTLQEKWIEDSVLEESARNKYNDLEMLGYNTDSGKDYYNFKSSSLLTTLNYIRNITTPIEDLPEFPPNDTIAKLNMLNKRYLFCYNDVDKGLVPKIQEVDDEDTREIVKFHPFNQRNYVDVQKATNELDSSNKKPLWETDYYETSKNFERLKDIMDIDFLYLHPLNSNYVLLENVGKEAEGLAEAAIAQQKKTAQELKQQRAKELKQQQDEQKRQEKLQAEQSKKQIASRFSGNNELRRVLSARQQGDSFAPALDRNQTPNINKAKTQMQIAVERRRARQKRAFDASPIVLDTLDTKVGTKVGDPDPAQVDTKVDTTVGDGDGDSDSDGSTMSDDENSPSSSGDIDGARDVLQQSAAEVRQNAPAPAVDEGKKKCKDIGPLEQIPKNAKRGKKKNKNHSYWKARSDFGKECIGTSTIKHEKEGEMCKIVKKMKENEGKTKVNDGFKCVDKQNGGGTQRGGGLVDQNYLYKINLARHSWLNDPDELLRFIQEEQARGNPGHCIQLDDTGDGNEGKLQVSFEKPFINQIFTGGKRKTRRKRNKSNKKKKKKIQIKNKSKKNRKKLKNKTRKK